MRRGRLLPWPITHVSERAARDVAFERLDRAPELRRSLAHGLEPIRNAGTRSPTPWLSLVQASICGLPDVALEQTGSENHFAVTLGVPRRPHAARPPSGSAVLTDTTVITPVLGLTSTRSTARHQHARRARPWQRPFPGTARGVCLLASAWHSLSQSAELHGSPTILHPAPEKNFQSYRLGFSRRRGRREGRTGVFRRWSWSTSSYSGK